MYGPVRTVVWQGSAGDRRPYADLVGYWEFNFWLARHWVRANLEILEREWRILWSAKTSCSRRNARGSVQMARIFLSCVQQLKCLCEAEWACSRPT